MPIELAVILVSDIHAGPDSPYDELRVPNTSLAPTPRTAAHSIPALARAIEALLDRVDAAKRVLLCAGDISTACHSTEIAAAGKALTQLADELDVPKKQRLLLPGNHDIDWPLTKLGADDPWYDQYRQRKFRDGLKQHAPTFRVPIDGQPVEVNVGPDSARFYLLDSAHEDRNDVKPHHGRLGATQLAALEAMLVAAPGDVMKCVALHHHVMPFAPTYGIADFSLVADASDLLSLLHAHSIPIVMHGHQHYPFFQQQLRGANPLTLISSGSTTASYQKMPESVPNTFHVVLFNTLHPTAPKGVLHTRMLTLANGWQLPILGHHHIAARRPFGAVVTHAQLEAWADEAILLCAAEKLVHIEEFLGSKPDGTYFCHHAFGDVIERRLTTHPGDVPLKLIKTADSDQVILQVAPKGRAHS